MHGGVILKHTFCCHIVPATCLHCAVYLPGTPLELYLPALNDGHTTVSQLSSLSVHEHQL
jgi:hypothetical protein